MARTRTLLLSLILAAAASLTLAGGSALASDPHATKKDDHGEAKKEEASKGLFGSADNEVILPTLIAPVTDRGRIRDYLYMYLVAIADNAADADVIKGKMPFIQDAMVREIHAHVLTRPPGGTDPEIEPLLNGIADRMNAIVKTKKPAKIAVNRIDTAPF